MTDVSDWLERHGLARYAERFAEEEIDAETLPHLTESDLREMGLPVGPRRRMLRALADELGGGATPRPAPAATSIDDDSQALARRAIDGDGAEEGERKPVTVLFADLRGSTALIQGLDAEAAVERMQPALDAMRAAVREFEGTVNRVQGDGIMALFGAPVAHEDHALRACLAGLRMRDAIAALGDAALQLRVGLNSGEAVVRAIRNDLTVEYEADGPAVHLAARMEQLADPGTVRVTRETWRLVEGHVEARALGALPVKGFPEPVAQYELAAPSSVASRWEGRARRGLTRFVGREAELAVLREAAAQAAAGRGQVVALVGEAGMGKSRLLHQFLAGPDMARWTVRVAAASPHGRGTPYLPLKQLLRDVIGATSDDDATAVERRLFEYLDTLDPDLASIRAPLQSLLDLEVADAGWHALTPETRRRLTVDAVRELVLRRARHGSLLFAVEDLHWIDEETQAVLDRLVESMGGASLFLLVTCRPEYRQAWYGRSYFVPVHVGPIPAAGRSELLATLLGADGSLDALKAAIDARSEGRPLYIEEIVRALADEGALAGERGEYRLARPVAEIPIPDTVQAVIRARVDRLEPVHKRLLQIAAVLGRRVEHDLLDAVAGMDADALRSGLAALQGAEMLLESRSHPAPEYVFKHALTESVAYESLLHRRRRTIHEAALGAIETRRSGRVDEQVELLAHHALRAERWADAVRYSREAGKKAAASSAYREATDRYEDALAALARLPGTGETTSTAIDIRLELRPPLGARAEYRQLLERLTEARELAASIGDRHRETEIAADAVHVLYHMGDVDEAVRAGEIAVHAARELDEPPTLIRAASNLAHAHLCRGEFRTAIDIAAPYAEALRTTYRHARLGTTGTSACQWLGNLCGSNALVGDFERALGHGEEAWQIAQESGLPFNRAMAGSWLAFGLMGRGDVDRAVSLADETVTVGRENDLDFVSLFTIAVCVQSHAVAGNASRALDLLEGAAGLRARLGALAVMSLWMGAAEAMAVCAAGDHERAEDLCATWLVEVERYGARTFESLILRTRGTCLARGPARDLDGASGWIGRAREVATRQDARPDIAHADLALARLAAGRGDPEQARLLATRALEAFEGMGMMRWVPEARALLTGD